MEFEEKVNLLISELTAKGVKKGTIAPRLWRWFWKMGWKIRPPLFLSFCTIAVIQGTYFGVFLGFFMWLFFLRSEDQSVLPHVIANIVAGGLFGVLTAIYCVIKRRKLGLGAWENYPKQG